MRLRIEVEMRRIEIEVEIVEEIECSLSNKKFIYLVERKL
jgi:hypothetical protein